MDAVTLLREQISTAHEWLEGTMADVTAEQADWAPPGIANPLGASYAHAVTSEDLIINGMLGGGTPLFMGEWAGKTGQSLPHPHQDWTQYAAWARDVRVDLPAARAYAQAVYAATDAYLAGLTPEDLDREVNLFGMNQRLGMALANFVAGHCHDMMGEISCLKGLQGVRGYPF
ncbi:MAG TPA: DinB family protein [Chloroflexia bacterium]